MDHRSSSIFPVQRASISGGPGESGHARSWSSSFQNTPFSVSDSSGLYYGFVLKSEGSITDASNTFLALGHLGFHWRNDLGINLKTSSSAQKGDTKALPWRNSEMDELRRDGELPFKRNTASPGYRPTNNS